MGSNVGCSALAVDMHMPRDTCVLRRSFCMLTGVCTCSVSTLNVFCTMVCCYKHVHAPGSVATNTSTPLTNPSLDYVADDGNAHLNQVSGHCRGAFG